MEFAGDVVVQDPTPMQTIVSGLSFLFYSPFFTVIKIAAAIYVSVLIVDIILLIILDGAQENYRKEKRGTNIPTVFGAKRKWKYIKARLNKGEQNHYKVAILEADQMVEKILTDVKYKQPTMTQKIEKLEEQHVSSAALLRKAHAVSARIVQEPDFQLSRKEAEETLLLYEQFMNDMEIFG